MYESYYGLHEKAFRKTPDPRYLYLNSVYEEALEQLLYSVEEMELALLTGEVGAGKTMLSRALIDKIGDRYEVAMILNPRLSPRQFLRTLATELGVAMFLSKPFDLGTLVDVVEVYASRNRKDLALG